MSRCGALGGFATPADPNIGIGQDFGGSGTDPTLINTPGDFSVSVNGSMAQQNPLLILVGAYDNNLGHGTPQISEASCPTPSSCPAATIGTYGLTADTATFTNTPGKDIAETNVGLTGDGSENFTNWSLGDTNHGFAAPTSFSLFVFAIPVSLQAGAANAITLDESNLAAGSYIIAFDCDNGFGSSSGCASGHEGQTPFTTAGLAATSTFVVPVPEPGSLALLGTRSRDLVGSAIGGDRLWAEAKACRGSWPWSVP